MRLPQMDGLPWKIHLKRDDDWGYPYDFGNPQLGLRKLLLNWSTLVLANVSEKKNSPGHFLQRNLLKMHTRPRRAVFSRERGGCCSHRSHTPGSGRCKKTHVHPSPTQNQDVGSFFDHDPSRSLGCFFLKFCWSCWSFDQPCGLSLMGLWCLWHHRIGSAPGRISKMPSSNGKMLCERLCFYMEVSINGGTPKWMVYSGKSGNPIKMDENWGYPYGNHHISPISRGFWHSGCSNFHKCPEDPAKLIMIHSILFLC